MKGKKSKGMTKAQFDFITKKLKKDGQLTSSGILAAAQEPDSPLHCLFEWNESKAAKSYRLIQARKLIKSVNLKIESPEDRIVHVPAIRGEGAYKRVINVVSSVSDFDAALTEAVKRLQSSERAVQDLHTVAQRESPDKVGILAIAIKGLQTAETALNKMH